MNQTLELEPRPAVAAWSLTMIAGAPAAAEASAAYSHASTNTKHVITRSYDSHLNDISWTPGGGTHVWVDLTVRHASPLAADRPAAFTADGQSTQHVVYRGADDHIYEIRR